MGLAQIGTPISSPNWEHTKLSYYDGGSNGSSDFFRGLDTKANVSLRVANDDNSLESCALTGAGLLLDGFNLGSR